MAKLAVWFRQQWKKKAVIYYSLRPISWLFKIIIKIRCYLYRLRWFRSYQAIVPVIVVGNLTVGGTGKTPLVIALANYLIAHGQRPGIVSRGYGSQIKYYPHQVQTQDSSVQVGDEPCLLFKQLNCPIVIDPNRARATAWLLSQHDCDIIISDDGLQHRALMRDIEIVVIDGVEKFGNQALLPAGPMREPIANLSNADLIVVKNGQGRVQGYKMVLQPTELYQIHDHQIKKPLTDLKDRTVHLVTGIGEPNQLITSIAPFCKELIPHVFADHHLFNIKDFTDLTDAFIVMTEKDAIKCQALPLSNIWVIKANIQLPKSFFTSLMHLLQYTKQHTFNMVHSIAKTK